MKQLKPVIKKLPGIRLFKEPDALFLSEEQEQINVEIITLQIVLSKVLNHCLTLRAANVMLKDILSYNVSKTPTELQNFFLVMEVYGHLTLVNFFEPSITPLSM